MPELNPIPPVAGAATPDVSTPDVTAPDAAAPDATAPDVSTPELPDTAWLERRITELEIKASLADDLLDQLNQTVYRQQQQIEFLLREHMAMRQAPGDGETPGFRSLRDELPPHY